MRHSLTKTEIATKNNGKAKDKIIKLRISSDSVLKAAIQNKPPTSCSFKLEVGGLNKIVCAYYFDIEPIIKTLPSIEHRFFHTLSRSNAHHGTQKTFPFAL